MNSIIKSNRTISYKNKLSLNKLKKEKFRKRMLDLYIKNKEEPLILYIVSKSFRSLHVNISTKEGRVLKSFTAGSVGYKKATRHRQSGLVELSRSVKAFLLKEKIKKRKCYVFLRGFGSKGSKFFKMILSSSLKKHIISIIDLSGLPFNGCRPKKLRRK